MPSPHEPRLREIQSAFAAALRSSARGYERAPSHAAQMVGPPDTDVAARLAVYENNTRYFFRVALERAYPVLRHRVGDAHFQQLAHDYWTEHPSTRGDLHWIGERFPQWLAGRTNATAYAWLADLARLEWARECAAIEEVADAVGAEALASVPPDQLEHLVFALQPSLRLVESPYPVFSVWLANQVESAAPVDQSKGSERGMARARSDGTEVAVLAPDLFSYLSALATGRTLGEAMAHAGLDGPRLTQVLGYLFSEELVTGVTVRSPSA
jgi:hypothetical protein